MNTYLLIIFFFFSTLLICGIIVAFYFIKTHLNRKQEEKLQELDDIAKRLIRRDMELSNTREQQENQIKELDKTAKALVRRDMELTSANEKLIELDRIKSEFISIAAHQLRTPLGSMRWNMEILLSDKELSIDAKERIRRIYNRNQEMIRLVYDLLTVSRIEQGRIQERKQATDISDVIKNAVSDMEDVAQDKGITIEVVEKETIPVMLIDGQHLKEVLQNILSNAVKYNNGGGKVKIAISLIDNMYVQISISDTGIGIPKKDQPQIFSKFFRGENAFENQTEGSGLGLFVAKSYVDGWGGKISFKSEEGKGTTFYIELPIRKRASQ